MSSPFIFACSENSTAEFKKSCNELQKKFDAKFETTYGSASEKENAKKNFVITDDEKEFEICYSVVEISEVIASHIVNGNIIEKNPAYPAELQPRDRENRVAMHLKI